MNIIKIKPIHKKVIVKEYYKITDPKIQEYAKEYKLTIEEAYKDLNEKAKYY